MRGRNAGHSNGLTVPVAILAAVLACGCSTDHADHRHAGVTATGNTGRIGGRVDSAGIGGAARTLASQVPVKVFLLQVVPGADSLRDSVTTFRGGIYLFEELPDAAFKVFAVSDADGWKSDTLRAEIREGSHVDLPVKVRMPDTLGVRKGMTWLKRKREDRLGIDFLHCKGAVNGAASACDPYLGDQPCTAVLPILCSKAEALSRPAYEVDYPSTGNDPYYGPWFEGRAALGNRTEGRALRSKAVGDSVCAASLGSDWKMAGFHDGRYVDGMDSVSFTGASWDAASKSIGAWGFYASTSDIPMDIRFWTYIDDQPGNCWDP